MRAAPGCMQQLQVYDTWCHGNITEMVSTGARDKASAAELSRPESLAEICWMSDHVRAMIIGMARRQSCLFILVNQNKRSTTTTNIMAAA